MLLQIYCRPTYEFVEVRFMDVNQRPVSVRNCLVRLVITTIYIVLVTLIACMIPFFGNFVALVGAIGFTPLVRAAPHPPRIPLLLFPAFCPETRKACSDFIVKNPRHLSVVTWRDISMETELYTEISPLHRISFCRRACT